MLRFSELSIKILSISTIFLVILQTVELKPSGKDLQWSCAKNATGYHYDLQNISGIWYEAARMPTSVVPACVQVTVPAEITNDTLNLQLDYVNNVNKKWQRTEENLTFPWNEETQKGFFEIQYGNEAVNMNFTFKLVATDYKTASLICYYTNYAPTLTMMKIMTRKQELDERTIETLQDLADLAGLGPQLTWVEQSSRCNHAQAVMPVITLLFILIFFILAKNF